MVRFAEMFGALAAEPRLRILRLLLSAHPEGLVVCDIQTELDIPGSTLSHHLEKLKSQGLVNARRDIRFLWYTANPQVLEELLHFRSISAALDRKWLKRNSRFASERPGADGSSSDR